MKDSDIERQAAQLTRSQAEDTEEQTKTESDFRIIAVTNRWLSVGDYFERLEKIAASDADALILREKDLPEEAYEVFAKRVMEICERAGKECILHSFVQTAAKLNCGSIHLPLHLLRQLAGAENGGILKRFGTVGASVHSPQEALEAQRLGADYVTAGHVFATDCKKGLEPRGIEFLEDTVKSVNIPVYAIGGISKRNLQQVKDAGASGVCVMSQMMTGSWYE